MLLDSDTSRPADAAGAASVSVPVTETPGVVVGVASARPCKVRRAIVSVAVWLTPEYVAVIVTVADTVVAAVSTVNVLLVVPESTCTVAGTDARALLLASVTSTPPVGAAALSVTVPVTANPPAVAFGESETDCSVAVAAVVGEVLDDPLQADPTTAAMTTLIPAIVRDRA